MLFTTDEHKSFHDTDCEDADFDYTPLSAIDVHWTYKKGDRTIDMGYVNVETLRSNLFEILDALDEEFITLDDFVHYYSLAVEGKEGAQVLYVHTCKTRLVMRVFGITV